MKAKTREEVTKTIEPIHDQLLVVQMSKENMSKGGIIIPDKAQRNKMVGTVVAIGPGKFNDKGVQIPMTVKVGDVVYFDYSKHDIKVDEFDYLMVPESDVLCRVKA